MHMHQDIIPMRTLVQGINYKFFEQSDSDFLETVRSAIHTIITEYSNETLKKMAFKHFEQRGKMLRPLFIAELAKSLNQDTNDVVDWAVACEILHNATLIHDDLQDGDEVRRGAPTTWTLYGSEQAINVGDFLLVIAPSPLYNYSYKEINLLPLFTQMTSRIVCGQVSEFEHNKFSYPEKDYSTKYIQCISGKTSTLFSGLALGVGIISKAEDHILDSLEEVFFKIGHLFQMQDDVLDLYGDKKRLEQGCDIKEGKFSFLVAKHLDLNPDDFVYLKRILLKDREQTNTKDIESVKELFIRKGTLNSCMVEIYQRTEEVLNHSYLKENYLFQSLVKKLISQIMDPIKHIET